MSDNEMLKCLIAFILGWLASRMMGNGFSVGAPPPTSSTLYIDGQMYFECKKARPLDNGVPYKGKGVPCLNYDGYCKGDKSECDTLCRPAGADSKYKRYKWGMCRKPWH